jgi:uncharacterized protein (TIGR00251 family)
MNYIKKISENEFIISLYIKPNSKNQHIFKPMLEDAYITISLCSVPRKNKANVELLKLLKKKLRSNLDQIHIISGLKNQVKSVRMTTFKSITEYDIVKLLTD